MTDQFVDPVTRHPYVFMPATEVHVKPVLGEIDCHHLAHPARHPLLQGLGGKAIREAGGQLVSYKDHHIRYHRENIEPILPDNDSDRLRYIGFMLAGYLNKGICFRGGNPRPVTLNNRQRERLRCSGEFAPLNQGAIRNFLVPYIMDQPMPPGYEGLENAFYDSGDRRERRLKGHDVFAAKVQSAAAGFADDYQEAWRSKLLDPSAPERATSLLHNYVGNFLLRDQIVSLLYTNAQSSGSSSQQRLTMLGRSIDEQG